MAKNTTPEMLVKAVRVAGTLANKIKDREAKHKEELREDKDRLKNLKEALARYIHKDNDSGIPRVSLGDGSFTAYARYEDKYKMVDREELIEEFVLEGIPDKYKKSLRSRLNIFTDAIVKDVCVEHRVESGAEEESGRLYGGKLIPGTAMSVYKEVRIVKGDR